MIQTDLSIKAEINLYYDLYIPPNAVENAPLLIAVHGYGAHKHYMMREAKLVAPEDFVIVSIQAPHQHFRKTNNGNYKIGFGWLTDFKPEESVELHQNFIKLVVENLVENSVVNENEIHLFGFSQACALNFKYSFTYPETLKSFVGICGGIPGDLKENENYKTLDAETFYLYSTDDEFYSLEKYQTYIEKLKPRIPNLHTQKYNAKHEITDEMREDVRSWFLTKQ